MRRRDFVAFLSGATVWVATRSRAATGDWASEQYNI
jgi:hypothetical protein